MPRRPLDSGVAGVLHATTPLWSVLVALALGAEHRPHLARLAGLPDFTVAALLCNALPFLLTNIRQQSVARGHPDHVGPTPHQRPEPRTDSNRKEAHEHDPDEPRDA
ncbi:hypothetical protein [Micromonospora sp. NPDC005206]|uniref:hypothetical protein n=1 Tax=Micromonospora sp. NPDC005206 TaxID=3157022 RepID=UPI0033BC5599